MIPLLSLTGLTWLGFELLVACGYLGRFIIVSNQGVPLSRCSLPIWKVFLRHNDAEREGVITESKGGDADRQT